MRKRIVQLAAALTLLVAVTLPTSSVHAAKLTCRFITSTNVVYPLRLSEQQYVELTNLGYGGSTTVRYHGQTYTITNIGAETNQFIITDGATTVTGTLSCVA